jgi:hypothetical protein
VEGRASGAKCLVAWTSVCRPKEDGGLGIKSLSDRNACLQVKLLHRLHSGAESPWAAWAWKQINGPVAAGKRADVGAHWAALVELMPLYRSISKPIVGDGQRTSFWDDDWLGIGALRHTAPALFSHATKPQASVAAVLRRGVRESLVARLTVEAENELDRVMRLVAAVQLSDVPDSRLLVRCFKKGGALAVCELYTLLLTGGVTAPYASFVWESFAPSKAKFFAWLLMRARIQSRAALLRRHILTADEAGCEICGEALETADHIMFGCPFAKNFWSAVGWPLPESAHVELLHSYAAPIAFGKSAASTMTILLCWNLWKHRNGVVFRHDQPCLTRLLRACREDAGLWRARLPRAITDEAVAWDSYLLGRG